MVIGDDGRRLGLGGPPGAAEERLGRGKVPALAKQHVDHLTVLIDSAVEVPPGGAMEEEDFVDVPTAAKPTPVPPAANGDREATAGSRVDLARAGYAGLPCARMSGGG